MPREVVGRAAAAARGLTRYYTGLLCKHGHQAERHVSTGGCVECIKQRRKRPDVLVYLARQQAARRLRLKQKQEREHQQQQEVASVSR